jgi:uncharacterized protein
MATHLSSIERLCERHVAGLTTADPAHDIQHIKRVVRNTRYLTDIESVNPQITLPAAWLHDCVQVAKDSSERSAASRLAAAEARRFLAAHGYPEPLLDPVAHAVEAHSYSANIEPRTREAEVVQDADRLDALGAVGVARCLLTGGALGSGLYHPDDPFCAERKPDDKAWMVDHFYAKLFRLPGSMRTRAGRREAERRVGVMERWLENLGREIGDW